MCITLFCTFVCPSLRDYDVKMPKFAFVEEVITIGRFCDINWAVILRYSLALRVISDIPWSSCYDFICHPEILRKHYLQFFLGVKMAPRETENNA